MCRRVMVTVVALFVVSVWPTNGHAGPTSHVSWVATDGSTTRSFCLNLDGAHAWTYTDSSVSEAFYSSDSDTFSFDPTKGKGKAKDETDINGGSSGAVEGKLQASWKLGGSGKAKLKLPGVYSGSVKAPASQSAGSCT